MFRSRRQSSPKGFLLCFLYDLRSVTYDDPLHPSSFLYLLKLFDAAVLAHFLQVGFECLDAGSTIREAANWGEALSGEVQGVGVLVNRTKHMGKWVSDAS